MGLIYQQNINLKPGISFCDPVIKNMDGDFILVPLIYLLGLVAEKLRFSNKSILVTVYEEKYIDT